MLLRYVTLWPWPLTLWTWTLIFAVDLVSRDQTMYQIWAKFNNPRLSYWRSGNFFKGWADFRTLLRGGWTKLHQICGEESSIIATSYIQGEMSESFHVQPSTHRLIYFGAGPLGGLGDSTHSLSASVLGGTINKTLMLGSDLNQIRGRDNHKITITRWHLYSAAYNAGQRRWTE